MASSEPISSTLGNAMNSAGLEKVDLDGEGNLDHLPAEFFDRFRSMAVR